MELRRPRFHFAKDEVFNGETYTHFLNGLAECYRRQEVFLVHDNAAYHKSPEVREWLGCYGHRFHLVALPPYSPDYNAVERVWHHVRMQATHNRYFPEKDEFIATLTTALTDIQRDPAQIAGYLVPFL